jgi:hypothetical protein
MIVGIDLNSIIDSTIRIEPDFSVAQAFQAWVVEQ